MTVWQVAHFIGGCVSLVKLTQERLTGNITESYKYYFQARRVANVFSQSYPRLLFISYTPIISQLKIKSSTNDTIRCHFFMLTYLGEVL